MKVLVQDVGVNRGLPIEVHTARIPVLAAPEVELHQRHGVRTFPWPTGRDLIGRSLVVVPSGDWRVTPARSYLESDGRVNRHPGWSEPSAVRAARSHLAQEDQVLGLEDALEQEEEHRARHHEDQRCHRGDLEFIAHAGRVRYSTSRRRRTSARPSMYSPIFLPSAL